MLLVGDRGGALVVAVVSQADKGRGRVCVIDKVNLREG